MIRPATGMDAEAIAILSGQLGYPSTADEIRTRLGEIRARGEGKVLVAELNGVVRGWVHVFGARVLESQPHAEVGGLVVEEGSRGRGIGRQLIEAAEEWAASMGYARLRVRSNVVRESAHRFYQALGYPHIKRQAVFEKNLGSGPEGVDH